MSIELKNINKWILPVYMPYMQDYKTRINVFYGGAGSGKSYFVVQKNIIKALTDVRRMLVVRKVGTTIKNSIWALFLELLQFMPATIKSVNKSDFKITLINGSEFIFCGLDDSEKIKSIQGITDIIIEEATELSLDDFTQLQLRLRSKADNNQIHLMFNPVSKANWVYKFFFEAGTPNNCIIVHTTYKDNKHLPKEYIESLHELELRNPAYYRIYVLGEFATLDKLVFPIVHKEIISADTVKGLLFWCGLDFGFQNDPTAVVWGYFNPVGKKLYITGEYTRTGLTNDKIADILIKLNLNRAKIVADSAEHKSIIELRNFGIKKMLPAVKGPDSIINGIDRLQRCEIHVDERCTNTIEEFDNYTWQKDRKTNEYINKPIDAFNHHMDAIRYGVQPVINKKQLEEYIPLY